MKVKFIIFTYSLILLALTFFSYSQIDLNLTLSSNTLYQDLQKELINLGYFNRPLSTYLFILFLILLYLFYFLTLRSIIQKKLNLKKLSVYIIVSVCVLFLAYPAFSHDIFNYMFDARIVTKYHFNPYIHKALDFPDDLWVRFMHWTHRTYPYGPFWLILTAPFSLLGFGKFTLTLFNFKLMFTLFHLANIYLIYQILKKVSPKTILLGTAFYALNPLILIESVVSPHNEVVMLFFLLYAMYTMIYKKGLIGEVGNLLISAGIKFVTILYLPYFIYRRLKGVNIFSTRFFLNCLLLISLVVFIEIIYREPYPWYFIPVIGITSFLLESKALLVLMSGISFGALLRYAPFLYTGSYTPAVSQLQNTVFYIPVLLAIVYLILIKIYEGWRRRVV